MQTRSASRVLPPPEADEEPRPKRRKLDSAQQRPPSHPIVQSAIPQKRSSFHTKGRASQAQEDNRPDQKRRKPRRVQESTGGQQIQAASQSKAASSPSKRLTETGKGPPHHKRGTLTPPQTDIAPLSAPNLNKLRTETAFSVPRSLEEVIPIAFFIYVIDAYDH